MGRSNREYNPNRKEGGRGKWTPDAGGGGGSNSGGQKQPVHKKAKKKLPVAATYQMTFNPDGTLSKPSNKKSKKSIFKNLLKISALPLYMPQQQLKKKKSYKKDYMQQRQQREGSYQHQQQLYEAATSSNALQLPCKHSGKQVHDIPWMSELLAGQDTLPIDSSPLEEISCISHNRSKKKKKSASAIRLPTDDADPELMKLLTEELLAFADYVRLGPSERTARCSVVEELTQLARGMMQSQRHRRFSPYSPLVQSSGCGGGANNAADNVSFQPFGSFAALSVCTYHSDVDLAMWGVVEGVGQPTPAETTTPEEEPVIKQNNNSTPSPSSSPPSKKQRQQKWKETLAALDEENLSSLGDVPFHKAIGVGSTTEKDAKEEEKKDSNICNSDNVNDDSDDDSVGDDAMPLFVLDRSGGEAGVDQHVTTKKGRPLRNDEKIPKIKAAEGEKGDPIIEILDSDNDDSSIDNDSADKLDGLREKGNRSDGGAKHGNEKLSTRQPVVVAAKAKKQTKCDTTPDHFVVSLESSDDDDDDSSSSSDDDEKNCGHDVINEEEEFGGGLQFHSRDEDDEDETLEAYMKHMEAGMVDSRNSSGGSAATTPTNHRTAPFDTVMRNEALDALSQLDRRLRRSRLASSVEFIRKARVPIIKFMTKLGVEVDISVGGLNGADTSLYAARQSNRYKSFAPVVLFLKVMMNQQDLDTPFQGGLGSFKLYVLVVHHIQQHMNLGGSDEPGEILLSFFFRYGGKATGDHHVHKQGKTQLSQDCEVKCLDGFNADISNVFKIDECIHLFGSCWKRLWNRVRKVGGMTEAAAAASRDTTTRQALLAELVHVDKLTKERHQSAHQAIMFVKPSRPSTDNDNDDAGVSPGATASTMILTEPPPPSPYAAATKAATSPNNNNNNNNNKRYNNNSQRTSLLFPTERNASQLAAGYGQKSWRGNDNNNSSSNNSNNNNKRPYKRMRSY